MHLLPLLVQDWISVSGRILKKPSCRMASLSGKRAISISHNRKWRTGDFDSQIKKEYRGRESACQPAAVAEKRQVPPVRPARKISDMAGSFDALSPGQVIAAVERVFEVALDGTLFPYPSYINRHDVGETNRPGVRGRPLDLLPMRFPDANPCRDHRAGGGPQDLASSGEDRSLTAGARTHFVESVIYLRARSGGVPCPASTAEARERKRLDRLHTYGF